MFCCIPVLQNDKIDNFSLAISNKQQFMLTAIGLSKLSGINASNFYYVIFHLDKVTLIYSELVEPIYCSH